LLLIRRENHDVVSQAQRRGRQGRSPSIPIVVLTQSRDPQDIGPCCSLHADAYILKAARLRRLRRHDPQLTACGLGLMSLPPAP
jgi:CheY-like chemotaxis protein